GRSGCRRRARSRWCPASRRWRSLPSGGSLRIRCAVVPVTKLETVALQPLAQRGGTTRADHGEDAALVAVVAAKRGGDPVGRLEVVAGEAELLVGVANDDQVVRRAAHERREVHEMADAPVRRPWLDRTPPAARG